MVFLVISKLFMPSSSTPVSSTTVSSTQRFYFYLQ